MAQIGTIKVETAGGPVELPVYELGDSGSNRVEAFRVQTASGPGFVPLAAVDEADRPYLRVQTANGVKAVDTSASGIPDSVLYYKIGVGDNGTNTLTDSNGSNDATSTGSFVWVNDTSVRFDYYVELDGANYAEISNRAISWLSDWSVGIEVVVDSVSGQHTFWGFGDGSKGLTVARSNNQIETAAFDGAYDNINTTSEPSTPYNVDIFVTYDSSANDMTLFVDEVEATGSSRSIVTSTTDEWLIGERPSQGDDLAGNGVAAFSYWNEIVSPSEFTQ